MMAIRRTDPAPAGTHAAARRVGTKRQAFRPTRGAASPAPLWSGRCRRRRCSPSRSRPRRGFNRPSRSTRSTSPWSTIAASRFSISTPADFTVRVDNGARRVVTAEWMPLMTEVGPQPPAPPDGYSTNESRSGGRLILIVIDQPNIRFGATQSILRTVSEFIDHLQPADRIAAVGLGPGSASTPFTADRERVKTAVARMSGTSRQVGFADFDLAQTEALQIRRGDPMATDRVLARECAGQSAYRSRPVPRHAVESGAGHGARGPGERRDDDRVAAHAAARAGDDRCAENRHLRFRRISRRGSAQRGAGAGHAGRARQNQSLHPSSRQPAVRHRRSAAAGRADGRSPDARRRARDAGLGRARRDVQHHRQRRHRLRADRVRAVGLLPARHRIRTRRQERGGASPPRRGRAARRGRAVAPDSQGRRRRRAAPGRRARRWRRRSARRCSWPRCR